MAQRTPTLWENEGLRVLVLTALLLGLLVLLFDFSARAAAVLGLITGSSGLYDLLNERYGLQEGCNWVFYGVGVLLAGAVITLGVGPTNAWLGAGIIVVGAWFVLDGAATMHAGAGSEDHEYVASLDDAGSGEAMLRMQMLGSVHEELRAADGPRSAAAVAEALGLAEARAASALDYLDDRGQVEHVDSGRYRAIAPRWGRLQPVLSFLRWLPRRLLRPFRLLLG